MTFIIPILVFFLNSAPALMAEGFPEDTTGYKIFMIKQAWHTGIALETKKVDTLLWPQVKQFMNYEWVDVGWGDEIFYLDPDPGVREAVLALFYRTPSTLRLEGFNSISRYLDVSDKAAYIDISKEEFDKLCVFISTFYSKNEAGEIEVLHRYRDDRVIYYSSIGKYHLFNTCNTWVAKALKAIGYNVKTDIVLADQLFREINEIGVIIKED